MANTFRCFDDTIQHISSFRMYIKTGTSEYKHEGTSFEMVSCIIQINKKGSVS